MQIDFFNVLFTVLSLIVLAVPGYILVKTKMVGEKASETLSNIVLYICQPMLVFMAFQGKEYSSSIGINMLIVAGLAFAFHIIMTVIMFVCVRNKDNQAKLNCVRFAGVFSNCGFMGLPMIQSLFAGQACLSEAIIYSAVVISVFNILSWTLGVYIITKDKKNISLKKIALNPTIIAVFVGFLIFIIAKRPLVDLAIEGSIIDMFISKFLNSCTLLANAVTPLSMMVIGFKLANAKLKNLFLDKWAYVSSFFKLIVMSLVIILIVAFLPIDTVVKYVVFFLLSMPSATSTTLFAVRFNSDSESASVMVLLSSIVCVVTIPLMFLVLTGLFGV